MPFIDLINYALSEELEAYPHNSVAMIEAKILEDLQIKGIKFKHRFYKSMLVLDFEVNGVNFAFDILEKNNILRTFF